MDWSEAEKNQIKAMKETIEKDYSINVEINQIEGVGFIGSEGTIAVLTFIFGVISKAILAEFGKKLFEKTIQLCQKVFMNQKRREDNSKTKIIVRLSYKDFLIEASINLGNNNHDKLTAIYAMDPINFFWDDLPNQCLKIFEKISQDGNIFINVTEIKLKLSNTEKKWILEKVLQIK